ncbi:hypothetical protein GCM10011574_65030 [Microbispora bryophytorum]|uniref:histidine kinase n=1 Tax=Microbispora bryophytorum TaxID=1460882 RepID=A0A8H9H905_9ACTN|nr:hypothetical protein GCM10011574_65030 [Microbispora bryophytorum]
MTVLNGARAGSRGQRQAGRLALIEALVGGALMVLLAVVGVVIVRRSLRPLAEIEATAEAIARGNLGSRIPDRDPRTEVGRLARALNGMLAQIEAAFQARAASETAARESEARMRRFVADASHELWSPSSGPTAARWAWRRPPAPAPPSASPSPSPPRPAPDPAGIGQELYDLEKRPLRTKVNWDNDSLGPASSPRIARGCVRISHYERA